MAALDLRRLLFVVVAASPLALVVDGLGCSVDELDLAGKQCPCTDGYVCDDATNTCVTSAGPAADADVRDAPPGGFVIRRFASTWTTSRSVRWDWEVEGDGAQFSEYQVIVGPSEDAVRRQDSTTAIFDRRLNPELGAFGGREPGSGGRAEAWTVTDKHGTERKVFARLVVRDTKGRQNASDIASATTLPENDTLQLFGDFVADGAAATPAELKRVTSDCLGGNGCLQGKVACDGDKTCRITIGIQGFQDKAAAGMTETDFAKAFVELAVRGGSTASAKPHADLVLTVGSGSCKIDGDPCRFRYASGWSFRPGQKEYRLVQVPLGMLRRDADGGGGPPLAFKDLTSNQMRVFALTIEGEWTEGATIGIDHLTLRW